jgi:hypothetical protein
MRNYFATPAPTWASREKAQKEESEMEEDPDVKALRDLLDNAYVDSHGEVFLAADGSFINNRGDRMHPYDLLRRIEKLRDAASRSRDLFTIIMAKAS